MLRRYPAVSFIDLCMRGISHIGDRVMTKKKSRKTNPRNIPLARRDVNKAAILDEATKDDMFHAWLLVLTTLIDSQPLSEISSIIKSVNTYVTKSASEINGTDQMRIAEDIVPVSKPHQNLNVDMIRSPIELEHFKKKVERLAVYTALCVICLGMLSSGRYSSEKLKSIFFSADLTLAEIEHGCTTYEGLKLNLTLAGIQVERAGEDEVKLLPSE